MLCKSGYLHPGKIYTSYWASSLNHNLQPVEKVTFYSISYK